MCINLIINVSSFFLNIFILFYFVGLSFGLETSRGALGEVGGLAGFNFHISGWTVILSYGKSKVILPFNNMDHSICLYVLFGPHLAVSFVRDYIYYLKLCF